MKANINKKLLLEMPIPINADPMTVNQEDISLEEMINRTFHIYKEDTPLVRQSKNRMTEIATMLLGQMLAATRDDGFQKSDELFEHEHRQQKVMNQELVFNALLGYPSKFKASVPISKIYDIHDPYKIIKQLTVVTPENATKFFIIKELTFQIYAHEISDTCGIVVPQIYNIQFYLNEEYNLVCEFVMDRKDKLPLDFMLKWINFNEKNDMEKLLNFQDFATLCEEEISLQLREEETLEKLLNGEEKITKRLGSCENSYKFIYKLRNSIVHFRASQETMVPNDDDDRWNIIINVCLELVLSLYKKYEDYL